MASIVLLHVYLTFAYYLCLFPAKVKKITSNLYSVEVSSRRKILSVVLASLILLAYFGRLRMVHKEMDWKNPVSFFKLLEILCSFVYKYTFLKTLYQNAAVYQKLLNAFHSDIYLHSLQYNFKDWYAVFLGLFLGLLLVFCTVRLTLPTLGGVSMSIRAASVWKSPNAWYKGILQIGRWIFFINYISDGVDENDTEDVYALTDNLSVLRVFELLLFIVTAISMFFKYVIGFFADTFILVHVLILWITVKAFHGSMEHKRFHVIVEGMVSKQNLMLKNIQEEDSLVLRQFHSLRAFSLLINTSLGNCMLPYFGEWFFSTVVYLGDGIVVPNRILQIMAATFYVFAITNSILSAEISRMMDSMRDWLHENQTKLKLGCDQLILLLDLISRNTVSITASGILPINYNVISASASALMAYFVIRLQTPAPI